MISLNLKCLELTGPPYLQHLRKTLHESSKAFVEHVQHVARKQFQPGRLSYAHQFMNKQMLALKNTSLTRNQD